MKQTFAIFMLASATFSASSAIAQTGARPRGLVELTQCQALAEPTTRLTCYDEKVATLTAAERSGEIIVVERTEMDAARRAVFGFPAPNLAGVLGGEQIEGLETALERVAQGPNGIWIFHLADGSVWRQIDRTRIDNPRRRSGETVRVRKAALGSHFLNLGDSRAVRVRRE